MFPVTQSFRLVKSEDLNHHGTLFAGRCAEWFVESAFISVARQLPPDNVVCLKIHGMEFLRPGRLGDVLCFESAMVYTGRSTIVAHVKVTEEKNPQTICTDGFITFCHVDEHTKSLPHGITVNPESEEEKRLYDAAKSLMENQKKTKS